MRVWMCMDMKLSYKLPHHFCPVFLFPKKDILINTANVFCVLYLFACLYSTFIYLSQHYTRKHEKCIINSNEQVFKITKLFHFQMEQPTTE